MSADLSSATCHANSVPQADLLASTACDAELATIESNQALTQAEREHMQRTSTLLSAQQTSVDQATSERFRIFKENARIKSMEDERKQVCRVPIAWLCLCTAVFCHVSCPYPRADLLTSQRPSSHARRSAVRRAQRAAATRR